MKPYKIIRFSQLDSTNQYVKNFVDQLDHKDVIVAEMQTRGRGRKNRSWLSPNEDNLYLTIVLKKDLDPSKVQNITQIAALAVAQTLESYHLTPYIKWPNDVLISQKKISGILSEAILSENSIKGLAVGIGININMSRESLSKIDQPATSMKTELNNIVDKEAVLSLFLSFFFTNFYILTNKNFSEFLPEWKKYSDLKEKWIYITEDGQRTLAQVIHLNTNGTLKIQIDNKTIDLYSGDIELITNT